MSQLYYLAGPIDQVAGVAGRQASSLTRAVLEEADRLDMSFYVPNRAYAIGDTLPSRQVDEINRAALDRCAGLVAVLPAGVPTLGTPVEVEQMIRAGRPALVVVTGDLDVKSVQVAAWAAHELAMVVHRGGIGDGLRWLRETARQPRGIPVRVGPTGVTPNRAYPDDAGLDLVCSAGCTIEPGGAVVIPTEVGMAIPHGYFGLILGRSSAWARHGLVVMPGVIDAGWRGDLFVSVWYPKVDPGDQPITVKPGDRLAQILILPVWLGGLVPVAELPPHPRGLNGFGSSGS